MNETSEQLEREWVEEPATDLLRVLFDYKPLSPEDVRRLRDGLATEPVLTLRLAECLTRLNPWLDDDGVRRAVAAVTRVTAVDVMEANESAYTALTYGVTAPIQKAADDRTAMCGSSISMIHQPTRSSSLGKSPSRALVRTSSPILWFT